ncbi:MAG: hypothetical protein QW328_08770 [Nitrososphaerota archaeon]
MEDMIDFPCSPTWLDFYHEQGLTPRHSGRPSAIEREILKNLEKLNRRLDMHEEILQELIERLTVQKQSKKPRSDFGFKKEEWT